MSIETINEGTRKTRKPHKCFDCYTTIPAGTVVYFFTGKMDGRVYTLYFHQDCKAAADHYRSDEWAAWYYDGFPPLLDGLQDSGEMERDCARLRGHFPHVICRIELHEQKRDIHYGETPQT